MVPPGAAAGAPAPHPELHKPTSYVLLPSRPGATGVGTGTPAVSLGFQEAPGRAHRHMV